MSTLVDFLLARIAEDEELWRMARDGQLAFMVRGHASPAVPPAGFAERHLADCEAKRRIVEEHPWPTHRGDMDPCESDDSAGHLAPISECPIFRALASVYADHPDYDEAWRP